MVILKEACISICVLIDDYNSRISLVKNVCLLIILDDHPKPRFFTNPSFASDRNQRQKFILQEILDFLYMRINVKEFIKLCNIYDGKQGMLPNQTLSVLIIFVLQQSSCRGNDHQSIVKSCMPQSWSTIEQIHYHFFLIIYLARFQAKPKKNSNIFLEMAMFMRTKNPAQCRSHHQKRTSGKVLIVILTAFFHDYYQIRLLDEEYAMKELRHYLTKVNTNFLTQASQRSKTEITLQSILQAFQGNTKEILGIRPESINQATQTSSIEQEPTDSRQLPLDMIDIIHAGQHLIVETCNTDIYNL